MSIVEPDQPLALRAVKRQRIDETMRTFLADLNLSNLEPNPMPRFRIDDEDHAIEFQQRVE